MQIDKVLLLLQYTTLARGSSNTARHGVITVREKTHQRGGEEEGEGKGKERVRATCNQRPEKRLLLSRLQLGISHESKCGKLMCGLHPQPPGQARLGEWRKRVVGGGGRLHTDDELMEACAIVIHN